VKVHQFVATLPGQPPSVNHTYGIIKRRAKDRYGLPVLDLEGNPRTYTSLGKKATVKKYQADIQLILQAAKPSGFDPKGLVYVVYDFYLGRDIDVDNTNKAIHDALATVLGINDRYFLPVARHKEVGVKEPYVRLTVLDAEYWTILPAVR
jgi:hypothetical protein